jgi:hydroxypyruvate isomerase
MTTTINRRELLRRIAAGSLVMTSTTGLLAAQSGDVHAIQPKGNIRHSVAQWTYAFLSLDELCSVVRAIGFAAIDLAGPEQWPTLKSHGIDCSMCNGAEIDLVRGWNRPEYHRTLIERYSRHIELVAAAGYRNLICFSGNRDGMDDETGLKNCVQGLKQIMSHAERHGVIVQMELFNSRIDHPDYMCDSTPWAVELCRRIGSPNFRILYDIYHMQVQEGDIIRTIRDHHVWFGHYHTAGVPGRHEIDDTQELYYPAIMRAIHDTGFEGYVAQEFMPSRPTKEGRIASLAQAIATCDV